MKRKVFAYTDMPTPFGRFIFSTVVLWLFLDRLNVTGWLAGAIWTIWILILGAALVSICTEENVKFFK